LVMLRVHAISEDRVKIEDGTLILAMELPIAGS
jgi:hypothetical protein